VVDIGKAGMPQFGLVPGQGELLALQLAVMPFPNLRCEVLSVAMIGCLEDTVLGQ
jgi:hypothetical protein